MEDLAGAEARGGEVRGVKDRVVLPAIKGLPFGGPTANLKEALEVEELWNLAWTVWLELKHLDED